jgi:hypothetical protein
MFLANPGNMCVAYKRAQGSTLDSDTASEDACLVSDLSPLVGNKYIII